MDATDFIGNARYHNFSWRKDYTDWIDHKIDCGQCLKTADPCLVGLIILIQLKKEVERDAALEE